MRAATVSPCRYTGGQNNFNPRCPCGQRQRELESYLAYKNFNPRCPCGQRQYRSQNDVIHTIISIHAAHAGSDGEQSCFPNILLVFQSTLPMRAATQGSPALFAKLQISIHAAHAGSDTYKSANRSIREYFNPRCPCGQRHFWE